MRHEPLQIGAHLRLLPENPVLSFVIPALNEEAAIEAAILAVDGAAAALVSRYEIIVVDDGSTDGTYRRAAALCATVPLRVIRLSRNFGKEQALMAGLQAARGEAVVTLDADLQEPMAALETMFAHWRGGAAMAYAVRAHRRDEPLSKRVLTRGFYKVLNVGCDVAIPEDARDFRLMDRRVVDAICAMPERNRFMKGLYGWVGFDSVAVPVELKERETGRSKFGFANLARLAITGVTSFTAWPLRVWTAIGSTIALVALSYGIWIALRTLVFGVDVPGWSTLVVGTLFLGGVQLISIGVLGEYVARIYTEVKGRPGYIVAAETSAKQEG